MDDTGVNFGELEANWNSDTISSLARGVMFRGDVEKDLGYDVEEEADYDEEELEGFEPPEVKVATCAFDLHKAPVPLRKLDPVFPLVDVTEDGNLKKLVLKKGTGRMLPKTCKVLFHYVMFINEDPNCIDSTLARRKPQIELLSEGEQTATVIPGLLLGLRSMEHREVASFYMKYNYAYGKLGCPPRIPPESDILVNVEILQIVNKEKLGEIEYMTTKERSQLSYANIRDAALDKRRLGNTLYKNGLYQLAVREYRKGIDMLEDYSDVTREENDERASHLATLFTNKAQAYLKMDKAPQACNACKLALSCNHQPIFSKIYYRFAQAKEKLGDLEAALGLVRKSIKSNPSCAREIREFERMLIAKTKKGDRTLDSLYAHMGSALAFGKLARPSTSAKEV